MFKMKVNIQHNVPAQRLKQVVPRRFHQLLNMAPDGGVFTVLVFSGDSVLLSTVVEKALQRLTPQTNKILAFGYNFTEEASNLLEARSALVFSLQDYHWTDERFKTITSR